MSPLSTFAHGALPAEVAPHLRCPAVSIGSRHHPSWPGYVIEAVPGVGYRAKFRCSACRFEFSASDAHLRRLAPPAAEPRKVHRHRGAHDTSFLVIETDTMTELARGRRWGPWTARLTEIVEDLRAGFPAGAGTAGDGMVQPVSRRGRPGIAIEGCERYRDAVVARVSAFLRERSWLEAGTVFLVENRDGTVTRREVHESRSTKDIA